MTDFAPIERVDGYLRIEDYGLIGDGTTAALVGRDGSIGWMCVPRFDSPPLFCNILDTERGGQFLIAAEGAVEARQSYADECPVLMTEQRTKGGRLEIRDAMPLRSGADLTEDAPAARHELLRIVTALQGEVTVRVDFTPRGGAEAERRAGGLEIRCTQQPDLTLWLLSSHPLNGLHTRVVLKAGERLFFLLRWTARPQHHHLDLEADQLLRQTEEAWRRWMTHVQYEGPQRHLVRHSAMVLKLCDHFESGAIVAAPTSSLPEAIGGPRNWDYRYAWIRDAAYSVYALRRVGLGHEATGFLAWVLDAIDRDGRPHVLYSLDAGAPHDEREDAELEGYRRSQPVRWGNAAYDQKQHDVYGEILDCVYQWAGRDGGIDEKLWERLTRLVDAAEQEWRTPDHGIWEVRTAGRPFTYSAAMCHVALDRGARLAERFRLKADASRWRATADTIARAIIETAWSDKLNSLTEHLGGEGGGLDASLLSLPLRRVIPATHPRMVATTEAIVRHLGAGKGLIYRYHPDESPDGLAGHEGAFLLCSFWVVDNLAKQGRLQEATDLYDSLCARANGLGLLPEQIDPPTGAFLGNYPQAFSHIGVISSGINLARALGNQGQPMPRENAVHR